MGLFWYRMAWPHATDTSSLAFNSAIFCRIAVALVYNVNMLVLPPEADNLRTSQTRFYCTFGKKGRLIVPAVAGRDYYLLIVPLLVLLLCLFIYLNVLSRALVAVERFLRGRALGARFDFGRERRPWLEDRGRELLDFYQDEYKEWAAAVIYRALRLRQLRQLRAMQM